MLQLSLGDALPCAHEPHENRLCSLMLDSLRNPNGIAFLQRDGSWRAWGLV